MSWIFSLLLLRAWIWFDFIYMYCVVLCLYIQYLINDFLRKQNTIQKVNQWKCHRFPTLRQIKKRKNQVKQPSIHPYYYTSQHYRPTIYYYNMARYHHGTMNECASCLLAMPCNTVAAAHNHSSISFSAS